MIRIMLLNVKSLPSAERIPALKAPAATAQTPQKAQTGTRPQAAQIPILPISRPARTGAAQKAIAKTDAIGATAKQNISI